MERYMKMALLWGLLAITLFDVSAREVDINSTATDSSGRALIYVASDTGKYYVLYLRNPISGTERPVSITFGEVGTTVLTESLGVHGSLDLYRVLEYSRDTPADTDGDGIDDVAELLDPIRHGPLNPSRALDMIDGASTIADRNTFEELSYQGSEVLRDTHLADLEYVKFYILNADTTSPEVLFMNTNTHRAHFQFAAAIGIAGGFGRGRRGTPIPGQMRGEIVYHPSVIAPNGRPGIYRFEFEPNDSFAFSDVQMAYELLAANMPVLRNNLAYYPMPVAALPRYHREKKQYDESRIAILLEEEVYSDIGYIPLNVGGGFGLLRRLDIIERPNPRDIVIYDALPNDIPRVGGIITTVPQTPLSHVNLRAIQDQVPNMYLQNAIDYTSISSLVDTYVHFTVAADGWAIRAATPAEVEDHYAAQRPENPQYPQRDLSITEITPLSRIEFSQSSSFGVKVRNLAVLRNMDFPEATIPDGYGIPFYFYDEYMKYNGLYRLAEVLFSTPGFLEDFSVQELVLSELRKRIRNGTMPDWMHNAISGLQRQFPEGTSIRVRSSTNNEDLPGFSGAGLYTSKTQHPDEGHLSKSIKQVYASLWSFRAFDERQFNRINHFSAAMGLLVHENYSNEKANGVAVTVDPFYQSTGAYYLNTQIGEDLVTNPEAFSVPEEVLLASNSRDGYQLIRPSNRVTDGSRILSVSHLDELRFYLGRILTEFRQLYDAETDATFAMEIEFKVTAEGQIAIKQARPWLHSPTS